MSASPLRLHDRSILIIGGGIAGASCAIRLARLGLGVELVEKSAFPRAKACGCCIGAAGLDVLNQLSLRDAVLDLGIPTDRWLGSLDARRIDLRMPLGVAISREVFDPLLLDAARGAGANVVMECNARIRAASLEGVEVDLRTSDLSVERRFDIVIVAAGLSVGGLNEILPWTEEPHGPFGVSCTIKSAPLQPGTIYMACQQDGYVGVVQLSDGQVDVAAALRSGSKAQQQGTPLDRMRRILSQSALGLPEFGEASGLMTTPPLRRTRLFGRGRVIAIGDAASYVEPFTGEGMTWAMQSGIAAADLIASSNQPAAIGEQWQHELTDLLRDKKRVCRMVANACRSRLVRGSVARILSTFPELARPLLYRIGRM